jgi:hypothetical protein
MLHENFLAVVNILGISTLLEKKHLRYLHDISAFQDSYVWSVHKIYWCHCLLSSTIIHTCPIPDYYFYNRTCISPLFHYCCHKITRYCHFILFYTVRRCPMWLKLKILTHSLLGLNQLMTSTSSLDLPTSTSGQWTGAGTSKSPWAHSSRTT